MSNALTDEVERGTRSLRSTLSLVTLAWMFGSVWFTATNGAPLTRFASSLNATGFQFGLLSAMPFIASLISLPASMLIERTGKRRLIFLVSLYFNRVLWIAIALVPLWMMTQADSARLAGGVFLLLMFLMHCGQAVGGPAWVSWMSDMVPESLRGVYFSRRRQWGLLPALPAALMVGWYLNTADASTTAVESLRLCTVIFLCATVFGIADIALYQFIPDSAPPPPARVGWRDVFVEPLRNRQFLWFSGCVGVLTLATSFMGQFVTLFMMQQLKVSDLRTQLLVIVAPALAQLVSFRLWGSAADRMGKTPVLAIAALGLVPVGIGWCFVDSSNLWLAYLLSAAGQLLWTGIEVANLNIVLELGSSGTDGRQEGGTHFVAVNSVIINIAGCLGGVVAGIVAWQLRDWTTTILDRRLTFFEVLFAGSAVVRLLAVVIFVPRLHEPAARPAHETLRYLAGAVVDNLLNVIELPARMLRLRK